MSTIFLQLTPVLISQIVVKNFASLCCIRKIHSLHKTKTFLSTFVQAQIASVSPSEPLHIPYIYLKPEKPPPAKVHGFQK